MGNVGLLCTTHDPQGNNLGLIKKHHHKLKELYEDIFITVSDESNSEVFGELRNCGFNVKRIPKKGPAHARREVLKMGLSSNMDYLHYCDFDRMLTWCDHYFFELRQIVRNNIDNVDYLILGRTERALCTHPEEWILTERITNKIFSLEFGKQADVTAGSSILSKRCAELILTHSNQPTTDAEWPMIAHRIGKMKVDHLAVEGLVYIHETNADNKNTAEADKWFARVRASYLISESSMKTGKSDIVKTQI